MSQCREKLYFCTRLSKRRAKEYMDTWFFFEEVFETFFRGKRWVCPSFSLYVRLVRKWSQIEKFSQGVSEFRKQDWLQTTLSFVAKKQKWCVFVLSFEIFFSSPHIVFLFRKGEFSALLFGTKQTAGRRVQLSFAQFREGVCCGIWPRKNSRLKCFAICRGLLLRYIDRHRFCFDWLLSAERAGVALYWLSAATLRQWKRTHTQKHISRQGLRCNIPAVESRQ